MRNAIIAGAAALFFISPILVAQQIVTGADHAAVTPVATMGHDQVTAAPVRSTGLDRLRQPIDPSVFDPTRATPNYVGDTGPGGRTGAKAPVVAAAGDR